MIGSKDSTSTEGVTPVTVGSGTKGAGTREQRAKGRERKAESRGQTTWSKPQTTNSREQGADYNGVKNGKKSMRQVAAGRVQEARGHRARSGELGTRSSAPRAEEQRDMSLYPWKCTRIRVGPCEITSELGGDSPVNYQ
jgi:hypothetical protein